MATTTNTTTTKGKSTPKKGTTSRASRTPKKGTASSASSASPAEGKKATPTKKEKKTTNPHTWLAENPVREGTDGKQYPSHERWLTNHEGSQEAQRPETTPTHTDDPSGWVVRILAEKMATDGWSARQLAIATGATPTKRNGKTRLVGGVSLGQIAAIREGKDVRASTIARVASAMGLSLR